LSEPTTEAAPALLAALDERVLVLDGAMGTAILDLRLDLKKDFLGLGFCCDILSVTRPEVVRRVHDSFLAVGCDAVETNTFGATPLSLARFGIAHRARELNLVAVRIAREACAAWSTPEKPRFVIGSIGPGDRLPTLGQVDVSALRESYTVQAEALTEGGVDAYLIETCQDPLQIEAALDAALAARGERNTPMFVSVTVEVTGSMLVGTTVDEVTQLLGRYPVDVVALNCATGPREMELPMRLLGRSQARRIGVYPNAGLPQIVDGEPFYPLTPEELADWLVRFVEEDGVQLVGGCCGTTPAHLAAVVQAIDGRRPGPRTGDVQPAEVATRPRGGALTRDFEYPAAPFLGPRVIEEFPVQSLLPYVNEERLFGLHWGEGRKARSVREYEAFLATEVVPRYHQLAQQCADERLFEPRAAFGFWHCIPEGDELALLDPHDESKTLARLCFPRQVKKRGLCIADFFHTPEGRPDVVALQVVTLGRRAPEAAQALFAENRQDDSQKLHGLIVEATDAAAEYVHRQVRGELGIAQEDAREMRELHKQGYRGARFPSGYPSWPDAAHAEIVLDLLRAESLDIEMGADGRLLPAPSEVALVCHHPSARYFTI